jgi:hypothetical protein
MKPLLMTNKLIDGKPDELLAVGFWGNQKAFPNRVTGPAQTCADPHKADLVEKDCSF